MKLDSILEASTTAGAIIALAAGLGAPQANPHKDGSAFVVVPNDGGGMEVVYLDRPESPVRKAGVVMVNDVKSLCNYANRHLNKEASVIYASLQPAKFIAVLNDHAKAATGWGDHRCVFDLKHSKEYDAWNACQKRPMNQADFAEFIESNLPDFVMPTGAQMYELALNFRAKQEASYSSAIRTQNGDVELSYTNKTEANAGAAVGKITVPERFSIEIPVWAGLGQEKRKFDARLRYRLGNGLVHFTYELDRPHKVVEQAFEDVLATIREQVKEAPIFFGTPMAVKE